MGQNFETGDILGCEEEFLHTGAPWAKSSSTGCDSLAVEDFDNICELKAKY